MEDYRKVDAFVSDGGGAAAGACKKRSAQVREQKRKDFQKVNVSEKKINRAYVITY